MFGKKKNEVKDIKHKVQKKEPKFYPNTLVNIKPAVVFLVSLFLYLFKNKYLKIGFVPK